MDVEGYLDTKFLSRDQAEVAMKDFSTLKRRINKWTRGTNDALSIFNLIWGIENEFDRSFIEHILATRFGAEDRKIYSSCLRFRGDKRMSPYNVEFSKHLERDMWKVRFG